MDYEYELTAIQTFFKRYAKLNSWRRADAEPKLARPVVLWESPYRGRARHLSRWSYTQTVKYYGKLYVTSVTQSITLQEAIASNLENLCGVLPILDEKGDRVGWIKNAVAEFNDASGELEIPFTISYEVSYTRTRPEAPPPPRVVGTRVTVNKQNQEG